MQDIIPESWQKLLLDVQKHDPKAVIAGGAIRDLLLGRKVKDIDLFTMSSGFHLPNFNLTGSHYRGADDSYPDANDHYQVLGSYNYKIETIDPPVNFVLVSDIQSPLALIEEFDFGICMAAWDGKELILSRHFHTDKDNKIFTLRHCRSYHKSRKRWLRIGHKYRRWYGIRRWSMVLSGQARLDIMLQKLRAKGGV